MNERQFKVMWELKRKRELVKREKYLWISQSAFKKRGMVDGVL